ncbi:MAG: M17 family peptidase N-terminal domain-containing protein, partial [Gammaproteobacteria bacterium]
MAYKVLSNISLQDTSTTSLKALKTDMLVLVINKDTKNNPSFKELDKASKSYLSKTIASHLKEAGSSMLLPKVNDITAENILLVKGLEKDTPMHKWLNMYKLIAKKGNQLSSKDLSVMFGTACPEGKDSLWMIEMIAKTIESNVYIFSETKNKTAKKPSVKKLTILTTGLSGSNLTKAKQAAKKGYAIG